MYSPTVGTQKDKTGIATNINVINKTFIKSHYLIARLPLSNTPFRTNILLVCGQNLIVMPDQQCEIGHTVHNTSRSDTKGFNVQMRLCFSHTGKMVIYRHS